jgi:hypothetical protein
MSICIDMKKETYVAITISPLVSKPPAKRENEKLVDTLRSLRNGAITSPNMSIQLKMRHE